MAQTSWPFHDSESGGTPVYEDQWSIMARQWAATGVVGDPLSTDLQVYANSSGREVHVRAGRACVRGHWLDLDAQVTLAIAANTSGTYRRDSIVARLDPSEDTVTLTVVEGTPAAWPAPAPDLTTTDTGIYDLPLATVLVADGAVSITAGSVDDQRLYSSPPPILCLHDRLPADPLVGQSILEIDTGYARWWDGTEWALVNSLIADSLNLLISRIKPGKASIASGGSTVALPTSPTGRWSVTCTPEKNPPAGRSVTVAETGADYFGASVTTHLNEPVACDIYYLAIAY